MKVFKAFMKLFEAPQRSENKKKVKHTQTIRRLVVLALKGLIYLCPGLRWEGLKE